jgi:hypothetical protein
VAVQTANKDQGNASALIVHKVKAGKKIFLFVWTWPQGSSDSSGRAEFTVTKGGTVVFHDTSSLKDENPSDQTAMAYARSNVAFKPKKTGAYTLTVHVTIGGVTKVKSATFQVTK